jgi:ribosomal protein L21E
MNTRHKLTREFREVRNSDFNETWRKYKGGKYMNLKIFSCD